MGRCRQCKGVGEATQVVDHYIFWPKTLTTQNLEIERIQMKTRSWLRFVSLLLAISGLIYFVLKFVLIISRTSSFINSSSALIEFDSPFFWLSVLAGLYVYYFLERDISDTKKIPDHVYEESNIKSQVPSLKGGSFVDVYDTLTVMAKKSFLDGHHLAERLVQDFQLVHLALILLNDPVVIGLFVRLGVNPNKVRQKIIRSFGHSYLNSNKNFEDVFIHAYLDAYNYKRYHIEAPIIFLALIKFDPVVAEVLYDLSIDERKIRNIVVWQQNSEKIRQRFHRVLAQGRFRPKNRIDRAMTAVATPLLDRFSEDLTEYAQYGYFLPNVERPDVTASMLRIFEGNHAPVLVGYPGVGKNGIIEELAERIVSGDVPTNLQNKRLVSVVLSKVVSGVNPSEASQRLWGILNEASRAGNVILVFKSIHGVRGITSGGEGSIDLAEVLVSGLKRFSLPCIASTTPEEYRKYLEGNMLGDYFDIVSLPEPSIDEAIQIVESKVSLVEGKYSIFFSYDALERLVKLMDKFVKDKYLPKKAIDHLDELALFVKQQRGSKNIVFIDDVDQFMKTKMSIPATRVEGAEAEILLNFESKIHERFVDQEQAVKAVSDAIRRARASIRDEKRPIVNLLFLGPTGVGKTELAKIVTSLYFGEERKMVRIDMSEYQEGNSISKLLGTNKDKGSLTEPVRLNPFSLVLLDEIDKANKDVLNLFLQIMDDGRVTDGAGRTIDFTNVILIATSNAGTSYIQDAIKRGDSLLDIEKNFFEKELREYFVPEFLNRFDGKIIFKPLEPEHVLMITRLLLEKVAERLEVQGVSFVVTEEAIQELATLGFDPLFGARPLRRVIQDRVDAPLAKYILEGKLKRRDSIIFGRGGEITINSANKL